MSEAFDNILQMRVSANSLFSATNITPNRYTCVSCGAILVPCSYSPENLKRPYFKIKDAHHNDCDINTQNKNKLKAKKRSIRDSNGDFPNRVPNGLNLSTITETTRTSSNKSNLKSKSQKTDRISPKSGTKNRSLLYRATCLSDVCQTFIDYPYDRSYLSLKIDQITGTNYLNSFKKLKSDIIPYPNPKIFYGGVSYKYPQIIDNHLVITTSSGLWKELEEDGKKKNVLVRPYVIKIDITNWSNTRINHVRRDIITAIEEKKRKEKVFIFFIGNQDTKDSSVFHVQDHRLICCMIGQILYPNYDSK